MEAPPPPYPPTRTRFQDYYSGYGQLHPPPLCPFRDVNTTEKDNMRVAFLFLEPVRPRYVVAGLWNVNGVAFQGVTNGLLSFLKKF
ncbi:hypothetical protein F2Q69_00011367 [Brassica cretica]|uniref:Uncharacterized protein n=1 Tax=Brassica cretica TaxID=69181 RepID=A0A8S9QX69_BRACR|nr:hypothetical protein F2Q69_00011367 [Brassica cretica]